MQIKTETEILREVNFFDMTDEIEKEIKNSFDDKPIKKYEIIFKEGVTVKECHRLEDIEHSIVSSLIITIN